MARAAGPEGFVSPSDLAALLPTNNPDAHKMLDRILRLFASHSIVNCCLKTMADGRVERFYSLAPVSKLFMKNPDGASMVPSLLLSQEQVFSKSWVFNEAMSANSTIILKKVLEIYKGFEGVSSLVDVGGGTGATLHMIVSSHPSIKGVNFDLPQVIDSAPFYPGVDHVAGDMFVRVPNGEAIILKWICHNWNDERCMKLLKNCHEALPENGKVIVIECILPESPDTGNATKTVFHWDVLMLTNLSDGKERTQGEYEALAKGVGFTKFH